LDISSCVEKKDIVAKLMASDAAAFDALLAEHAAWKAGGCEGPSPAKRKRAGESEGEGSGGIAGMMGADEGMSAESAKQMKAAMEGSLPVFLSTLVSASLLDVEVTLKMVCKKVLHDHSVDDVARSRRGAALRIIGLAFQKAKGTNKQARGEVDAKHVIEGTMMRTMAKAQGQEVDDDDDFVRPEEEHGEVGQDKPTGESSEATPEEK